MKLRKEWGNIKPSAALSGSGNAARTSKYSGQYSTANLNRQIRSLTPGQTLRGEVVSRNGSEVQIRISDDLVLQAKIDQNMNLEVGKNMTFEVRNNGSVLTLSPLFENMSADVNVLKALDMAGLPVNETSVSMTDLMMKAGLSVDRNSLQQVYRELSAFPQAQVSDIVNLHKLGMPVNEANVEQMMSYRNLTHQLLGGMDAVFEAIPEAMDGMLADGNRGGVAGLYQELFNMLQQGQEEAALPGAQDGALGVVTPENAPEALETQMSESETGSMNGLPQGEAAAGTAPWTDAAVGATPQAAAGVLVEEMMPGAGAAVHGDAENAGDGGTSVSAQATAETVQAGAEIGADAPDRAQLAARLLSMVPELPLSSQEAAQITDRLQAFAQGNLSAQQFFQTAGRLMEAARMTEDGVRKLHQIFSEGDFRELIGGQLKKLWTMRPEELEEPGKLDELYKRMDRQLKGLAQALESGGQSGSTAFRAVDSLSRNIDFLNQLNQMYAYVQIPLRLLQGEAQGELYVYTNKRSLAANEGKISALLHLDMEHLGPVDVYVLMEQNKVSTKFYVRDDEMLDFLEAHMDVLIKRLADRGYDCSFSLSARGEQQEENSGIGPILRQEKGVMLSQYAFDMRA